jgi:hypothetical protein
MAVDIEKIAFELATLSAGAGDDDFGSFVHFFDSEVYDDEGNGPIWNAICDRAEVLIPTIVVTDEERASWTRARREFNACQNYESQAFGI